MRNPEFGGEDIHRPDGKNAEANIGSRDPVGDFIDCSIPARRDDRPEFLLQCLAGQFPRVPGFRGHPDNDPGGETFDFLLHGAGPVAFGRRVEDDENFLHIQIRSDSFPTCASLPSLF